MRFFIFLPAFLIALIILGAGIAMLTYVTTSERRMGAHMQAIKAGQVQPETLTVVRKYLGKGYRSSNLPRVVFSTLRDREVDQITRQSFYDAAKTGDPVKGYLFPDGYVIPKTMVLGSDGVDVVKWFFLAPGLLGVFFVIALMILNAGGRLRVRVR